MHFTIMKLIMSRYALEFNNLGFEDRERLRARILHQIQIYVDKSPSDYPKNHTIPI